MKNIFIALLLISTTSLYGQVGNQNITYKDSIELIKIWKKFKKELYLKDIHALKLLSCKEVVGEYLFEPISVHYKPYISNELLLTHFFQQMFPNVSSIISKDQYKIAVYSSIKDKSMKIKYPTQYQIWFTQNSKPGYQFAFLFNKIKGRFKFFGLTTTP